MEDSWMRDKGLYYSQQKQQQKHCPCSGSTCALSPLGHQVDLHGCLHMQRVVILEKNLEFQRCTAFIVSRSKSVLWGGVISSLNLFNTNRTLRNLLGGNSGQGFEFLAYSAQTQMNTQGPYWISSPNTVFSKVNIWRTGTLDGTR